MDYKKRLLEAVSNSPLEYTTLKTSVLENILTEALTQIVTEGRVDEIVEQFEKRINGDDDSFIDTDNASFDINHNNVIMISDVSLYYSDLGMVLRSVLDHQLVIVED